VCAPAWDPTDTTSYGTLYACTGEGPYAGRLGPHWALRDKGSLEASGIGCPAWVAGMGPTCDERPCVRARDLVLCSPLAHGTQHGTLLVPIWDPISHPRMGNPNSAYHITYHITYRVTV